MSQLMQNMKERGFRVSLAYQEEGTGKWKVKLVRDFPEVEGETLDEALQKAWNEANPPQPDNGGFGPR